NLSVIGGYARNGDQEDGETVLELSASRVMHFFEGGVHLFDVSNPALPSIVKTVSAGTGSVNGAIQVGNYVLGANKGGTIDVFEVSDMDNFSLVGSYDAALKDGAVRPHDIDITDDGEHIVVVTRPVPPAKSTIDFAIYKVFDSG